MIILETFLMYSFILFWCIFVLTFLFMFIDASFFMLKQKKLKHMSRKKYSKWRKKAIKEIKRKGY